MSNINEVEYILKVVLKARDELAASLAKARTEIRGFTRDANGMNSAVTNLNAALQNFDGHLGNIEKKFSDWRAAVTDINRDGKELAKTFDTVGKNAETSGKKVGQAVKSQEDMRKAANALRAEYEELVKAENLTDKSREGTVLRLKEIGRLLENLAKKASDPKMRNFWANYAAESKQAAKKIIDDQKAIEKEELESAARRVQISKDLAAERARIATAAKKEREAAEKKAIEAEEAAEKARIKGRADAEKEYQASVARANAENAKIAERNAKAVLDRQLAAYKANAKEQSDLAASVRRERLAREAADAAAEAKARSDAEAELQAERLAASERAAKAVEANEKKLENRQAQLRRERAAKEKADAEAAVKQAKITTDEIGKFWAELHKELTADDKRREAEVSDIAKSMADDAVRLAAARASAELEIETRAQQEKDRIAKESERQRINRVVQANKKIEDELLAQIERESKAHQQQQIQRNLEARLQEIGGRAAGGRAARRTITSTDRDEVRAIAREYDRLANSVRHNSDEFRYFSTQANNARRVLRGLETDSGRARRGIFSLGRSSREAGENVATLDNKLRGIILLAVASFAEQLTTAIAGLGGELVALASSAAMAGAALGGILAAGAAQALPVIGLLAGAFQRVNSVMDAFQQNQKLQQAQATDAEKRNTKAIDQSTKLANASDAVAAANERLADSRKDLTKAQKEGTDQLQDLINAERDAALAARGANLDVKAAQQALAEAVSSGASALEIQQKQLAVDQARQGRTEARQTLRRATRARVEVGGDIGKLPDVQNAEKALRDAQRAADRAGRSMDDAAAKAERAGATTQTAAANLHFFLSQLSPAERQLYKTLNKAYEDYRRVFIGTGTKGSGIYGTIVYAFANAVEAVDRLMKRPKFVKTISDLADEIAKQIDKITKVFTGDSGVEKFSQITKDATENIGPLTDMALKLADAFLNIAQGANPAFQDLIKYIGPVVDKFLGLTENKDAMEGFFKSGEQHLEAWLDLFGAIGGLFAALIGVSAKEGKTSIEDLTKSIKNWTDWIDSHHDRVEKFFSDAKDVAYALADAVAAIAVALAKVFTPEHLKAFTDFIEKTLIPSFISIITMMGDITDKFLAFANSDFGSTAVKIGLIAFAFAQISSSAIGAFKYAGGVLSHIKSFATGIGGIFQKLKGDTDDAKQALKDFDTEAKKRRDQAEQIPDRDARAADQESRRQPRRRGRGVIGKIFGGAETGAAAAAGGAAAEAGGAALAGGGAGALAIAAPIVVAVAAVVALLAAFGKLDDIWKAIKDTASEFMKDIQPAVKTLQDALDDLGVHVESLNDVWNFLWDVLGALAEYIATDFIEVIKGLGKIAAGVVIAIIDIIAGAINIVHGVVDVIIGFVKVVIGFWKAIFTGNTDLFQKGFKQILDGFENLVKGIIDILGGIVLGVIKVFEGLVKLILAPFKAAWAAVKKFFGIESPSKLAMELGKSIIDGFVEGIRAAGRAIAKIAGWLWDRFTGALHKYIAAWEAVGNWIKNAIRNSVVAVGHAIASIGSWIWNKIKDAIRLEIQGFKNIGTWIKDAFSDAVHTIGSGLEDIGGRIIGAIVKGIKKAPQLINDAINWLLDHVPGGGAIKKVYQGIGTVERKGFAAGGPVPGSGSGDTVPARLTPGEHVWTKGEVEAAGGHGVMFALRALFGGGKQGGPLRYALGGAVFDPLTGTMHGGSTAAAAAYDPLTSIDYAAASKRAADARKKEADERKKDLQTQREDYRKSGDQRAEDTRVMWNDMLTTTRRFANDIEKQIRDMRVNTTRTFGRLSKDVVASWSATWQSLMEVTHEGLFYIGHETNKALTAMGEDAIHFHLTAPANPSKNADTANLPFAAGGFIGSQGQRGRDRGSYALGAGEAVLNWAHQKYIAPAVEHFYGHPFSETFNRVRGYHAGGKGDTVGFAGGREGIAALFDGHPSNVAQGIIQLVRLIKKKWPGLLVTSTTDHSLMTTSGNVSDHSTGHGVDMASGDYGFMNKVAAWIKTSGLYKKLKQAIHNPNLAVNRGELESPPGIFAGAVWAQHANHIHLAVTGLIGDVANLITNIAKRTVAGPDGALKTLAQSVYDAARKAANKLINDKSAVSEDSAGQDPGGGGSPAPEGQHKKWIVAGLRLAGVPATEANIAAQYRLDMGESGGNPKIIQQIHDINSVTGNLARGIAQVIPPTFAAYKVKGHDDIFNPIDNIAASARYQIAKYGHLVGHPGYAAGGEIPGGDGTPIGIIAHAGEWVLNKLQQSRVASLLGISREGLGSILGFYGGAHFAGGGDPGKRAKEILASSERSLANVDDIDEIVTSFSRMAHVLRNLDKVGKLSTKLKPWLDILDVTTRDNGLLDKLRESIERTVAAAALRVRRAVYQVGPGRAIRRVAGSQEASELVTSIHTLDTARSQRTMLLRERTEINKELGDAQKRADALTAQHKKVPQELRAEITNLTKRLNASNEAVQQNVEDIFAAQEAANQALIAFQQKEIDDINEAAADAAADLDVQKRIATAFGRSIDAINDSILANMQSNHDQLRAELDMLTVQHADPKLLTDLRKQVADLEAQIAEFAAQRFQDSVDNINKIAQRRMGHLDIFQRMIDATGAIGRAIGVPTLGTQLGMGPMTQDQIFTARGAALETQRSALQGKLREAQGAGRLDQIDALTDQLAELDVAIVENTKSQRDAKVQAAADAFDFASSMNDLEMQLIDAKDAVTGLTSSSDKLALLNNKATLLANRQIELQQEYNDAVAAGDDKAANDLARQLKQNEIAIWQNTKAIDEATGAGSAPQSFTSLGWSWFRSPIFNGLGALMPQYNLPPSMAGLTGTPGGPSGFGSGQQNGSVYNTNITVNEAGQPIDPTQIAGVVTFAQATAP